MRSPVAVQVGLVLAVLFLLGIANKVVIFSGAMELERRLDRLADVDEPLSASAAEMEINVNGITLAILKYLATTNPLYQEWIERDVRDFREFHERFAHLARDPEADAYAAEIGRDFDAFVALGRRLMADRDMQSAGLRTLTSAVEEIDGLIESVFVPGGWERAVTGRRAVLAARMQAELAEAALRIVTFQRSHDALQARKVADTLTAFNFRLEQFGRLTQSPHEAAAVARAETLFRDLLPIADAVTAAEARIDAGRTELIALRGRMDSLLDDRIQVYAQERVRAPRREAQAAADRLVRALHWIVPAWIVAVLVVGAGLVHLVLRPLRDLRAGVVKVASGDFGSCLGDFGGAEFGDLAREFNRMVTRLRVTTVSRDLLEANQEVLGRTVEELRQEIAQRERAERVRADLEAEVRRHETMSTLGMVVAGVAHEVRNPLFGISATVDALGARFGEQDDLRRFLAVLDREVDRLRRLMDDLLRYGNPAPLELRPESPAGIAEAVMAECESRAGERRVSLVLAHDETGGLAIPVDRARVIQVLQNVVDNALHHAPPGSQVEFLVVRERLLGADGIAFAVRDAGKGFTPEDMQGMFTPFYSRRKGGTGLGLAIAARIVGSHRGNILPRNLAAGGAEMKVWFRAGDGP